MDDKYIYSKVAGTSKRNDDGRQRQKYIHAFCKKGMPLILRREPNNPQDHNAISVWILARSLYFFTSEVQIGYLSSDIAAQLAPHIDTGGTVLARIMQVTGGTPDKPAHGVNIQLIQEIQT